MNVVWTALGIVGGLAVLALLAALVCFRMAFYAPKKQPPREEYPVPPGEIYVPYYELMRGWIRQTRALPHEDMAVVSFDGLTLRGRYYEYAPGAPMELMFHGYRGDAERDLCGGVQRCFAMGRNVLIVDQRCCGSSEGCVITFGVRESRDCLTWVEHVVAHFGQDVRIILTGISMGATTVLLAVGQPLPPQVVGVLADCGYTTARDIIKKVIRQMGLPAGLCYPFVRLGARLYGGFDPDTADVPAALKNCTRPVFFAHGETDDFVPCDMSRQNYEACPTAKALYTVPGAGHGLAFPAMQERYLEMVATFFDENGVPTQVRRETTSE